MLSTQLETTHLALAELAGEVDPAQWCLIRACIEDLKDAASKARRVEGALLYSGQQEGGRVHVQEQ